MDDIDQRCWPWSELGIARTSDSREIRRAYALGLKSRHPEEDPSAFQAWHAAYQAALELARMAKTEAAPGAAAMELDPATEAMAVQAESAPKTSESKLTLERLKAALAEDDAELRQMFDSSAAWSIPTREAVEHFLLSDVDWSSLPAKCAAVLAEFLGASGEPVPRFHPAFAVVAASGARKWLGEIWEQTGAHHRDQRTAARKLLAEQPEPSTDPWAVRVHAEAVLLIETLAQDHQVDPAEVIGRSNAQYWIQWQRSGTASWLRCRVVLGALFWPVLCLFLGIGFATHWSDASLLVAVVTSVVVAASLFLLVLISAPHPNVESAINIARRRVGTPWIEGLQTILMLAPVGVGHLMDTFKAPGVMAVALAMFWVACALLIADRFVRAATVIAMVVSAVLYFLHFGNESNAAAGLVLLVLLPLCLLAFVFLSRMFEHGRWRIAQPLAMIFMAFIAAGAARSTLPAPVVWFAADTPLWGPPPPGMVFCLSRAGQRFVVALEKIDNAGRFRSTSHGVLRCLVSRTPVKAEDRSMELLRASFESWTTRLARDLV